MVFEAIILSFNALLFCILTVLETRSCCLKIFVLEDHNLERFSFIEMLLEGCFYAYDSLITCDYEGIFFERCDNPERMNFCGAIST